MKIRAKKQYSKNNLRLSQKTNKNFKKISIFDNLEKTFKKNQSIYKTISNTQTLIGSI